MIKKIGVLFTILSMAFLLVACASKRNDLTISDFPSIKSELTEKELVRAVGAPHEESSSISDVTQLYEKLLVMDLSGGESLLSHKSNWTIGINGFLSKYYVYKLKDGKSVVAFISDGKVVAITKQGVNYE